MIVIIKESFSKENCMKYWLVKVLFFVCYGVGKWVELFLVCKRGKWNVCWVMLFEVVFF